MYNNELTHWGVKGMKWGVRRYQNKDGSLTPAGQKRYDIDTSNLNDKNKKKYKTDPDKWVKEDLERTKNLSNESRNLANNMKTMNDRSMKNKPRPDIDLSNMTDKEMRDAINRAFLERQYIDMCVPKNVSKGRETASKVFETAGDVLAITSSALGVALSIRALMGK